MLEGVVNVIPYIFLLPKITQIQFHRYRKKSPKKLVQSNQDVQKVQRQIKKQNNIPRKK
jgi:hypothetical protein